jgi:hypothetical protein
LIREIRAIRGLYFPIKVHTPLPFTASGLKNERRPVNRWQIRLLQQNGPLKINSETRSFLLDFAPDSSNLPRPSKNYSINNHQLQHARSDNEKRRTR